MHATLVERRERYFVPIGEFDIGGVVERKPKSIR
jgi:hypothetical protein